MWKKLRTNYHNFFSQQFPNGIFNSVHCDVKKCLIIRDGSQKYGYSTKKNFHDWTGLKPNLITNKFNTKVIDKKLHLKH